MRPNWAPVPRGEGLALSPDHRTVYTDDLFTGQIYRVPLEAPDRWTVAGRLPGLAPGLDHLTMTAAGDIFVAAHLEGRIYRFRPEHRRVMRRCFGPVEWMDWAEFGARRPGRQWICFVRHGFRWDTTSREPTCNRSHTGVESPIGLAPLRSAGCVLAPSSA